MKIIGLDIGTTNVKGILFDENGQEIYRHSKSLETIVEKHGIREQDVNHVLSKTIAVINNISTKYKNNIKAISLSSAMHSMILCDEKYNNLSNSLIWSDHRSANIIDDIKKDSKLHKKIHDISGVPLHPMSWIGKILWFQKNKPKIWTKTKKILTFKEYFIYKVWKKEVVDVSMAASTGLLNIYDLSWDKGLLDLVNIDKSYLSEIKKVTFTLKANIKTNIVKFSLPLTIGSSDGCLVNLGSNVFEKGDCTMTVGTSGAVRTTIKKPWVDKKNRIFCYPVFDDFYVIGGPTNNGGNVLDWYCKNMRSNIGFSQIWKEFDASLPGANNLIFLPYLNGERAPHWDANAKGGFVNLEATHNINDITRSILEGITYNIGAISLILKENIKKINKIYLTGGILNEPKWIQLFADIIGAEIIVDKDSEAACKGAAYLGFMGLKHFDSIEHIKTWNEYTKTYKPNMKKYNAYAPHLLNFINAYYRLEKSDYSQKRKGN